MMFVWVLESEGLYFEQSAAVALMGKYNVRLFHDPVSLVHEYAKINGQSKPLDQHLVYFNTFKNKIFDVSQVLKEIRPNRILVQDLSSQDLIRLSVQEIFTSDTQRIEKEKDEIGTKSISLANSESFKYKELQLNLIRLECSFEEDQGVQSLSPKEAFILAYLMKHAGIEVDREDLSKAVWGEIRVSNRTLDSHISRLRTKLNRQGEVMIEAIYGGGYILR